MFYPSEKGFSLVEVLMVMMIVSLLTGLAWSGFLGLRTTMFLYQSAQTARSDIVYAQRSAMLLDRLPNETWIHGIGLALDEFSEGGNQMYSLIKVCDDQYNYSDYPNVRDYLLESIQTGDCSGFGLSYLAGKKDVSSRGGDLQTCTTNSAATEENGLTPFRDTVAWIVFESINGRPHFYNESGVEIIDADFDGVRLTYYIGNRYSSVSIKESGEIVYEGYDPEVTNPCLL